jgi:hypothetical protein
VDVLCRRRTLAAFDGIHAARSQFFKDVSHAFFDANRDGAKASQTSIAMVFDVTLGMPRSPCPLSSGNEFATQHPTVTFSPPK